MVCKHILQFSPIFDHAMQLSFDDYGNDHHHHLLRRYYFDQTNHLKGKILNDYKMYDTAGYRRSLEFIWSSYSYLWNEL